MRKVDGQWVTDEPDADFDQAWASFWRTLAPEIARVRLSGQPAEADDSAA